jgi:nucleotide-binding universal stress UspA family protein
VLVPVSGGSESDPALALAVRLACALDLAVHVVHVVDADATTDDELAARARYADEMHHEYPAQLEELVARALPALAPHECHRVRDIVLGHGDVADQLVQLIKRDAVSVLGVGWHGQFAAGRADVLKKLITVLETPVLLVKCLAPTPFRLKAGEQLA